MDRIGVRELRQNASRYLERVKNGESIEVTERGVPIAVLGPVATRPKTRFQELIERGEVVPATGTIDSWLEANPVSELPANTSGLTSEQILDELREERL